jgi:hypothetical protein
MAAGAGVLAGVGASYAWSRLHHLMKSSSEECWAGEQHFKSCAECRMKHSPASDCAGHFSPQVNLSRDDMMNSGFVPSNVTGPLKLIITEVLGTDFTPEKLCPPSNWTGNASGNTSGNVTGSFPALFVTLTRLASTPVVEDVASAEVHHRSAAHFVVMAGLAACLCMGCVACGMHMRRASDDHDPSKMGPPVQFPPPVQVPAAHFQQPHVAGFVPGQPHFAAPQYNYGQPMGVQAPPYRPYNY